MSFSRMLCKALQSGKKQYVCSKYFCSSLNSLRNHLLIANFIQVYTVARKRQIKGSEVRFWTLRFATTHYQDNDASAVPTRKGLE